MTRLWININRNGRLGNRLFSRAHVYAAAIEFGATVVDWGLADCARHFPAVRPRTLPAYPLGPNGAAPTVPDSLWTRPATLAALRLIRPRRTGRRGPYWSSYWGSGDPDAYRLDGDAFRAFTESRATIVLDGYKLRCTDWVRRHAPAIRAYFAPPHAIRARWAALQESWHGRWETTVAVHLRASDFRKAQGGRYYLTPAEYAGLLRASPALSPERTLFVLFSDESFRDDDAYAALVQAFAGLDHVFMHGDLLDDLWGLASCDRIVGPASSTFSRWSAFAADRPWAGVARTMLEPGADGLQFRTIVPWDY